MAKKYICDRCKVEADRQMDQVEIPTHSSARKFADLCCACNHELIKMVAKFLDKR
jgi:hypothetical protein